MKTQIKFLSTIFFTLITLVNVFGQQKAGLYVAINLDQPTCNRYSDGSITITPVGGVAPYQINWSNGSTSQTITNLLAGNYSFTVVDAIGGVVQSTVSLADPLPVVVDAQFTNVTSYGAANGTIDILSVNNTQGSWTYEWTSTNGVGFNPNTEDQTGLVPNSYKFTVTDDMGCQGVANFTITQPNPSLNGVNLPKPGKIKPNSPSQKSFEVGFFDTEADFRMYPNPSEGKITIENDFDGVSNLVITSLQNGELFTHSEFNTQIEIDGLTPGMYLVKVDNSVRRLIVK